MSRLASTMESCRARGLSCPALPSIQLQLASDGPDLVVTIGQLTLDATTRRPSIASAEQVRCLRGVPRPEMFREAGDPGPKYCTYCRAAYGYAVLATVYGALANLLRPDLILDFSGGGGGNGPVDAPPVAS